MLIEWVDLMIKLDALLGFADVITQAGTPGARVFINEDIPELTKRKSSDIYRHVCFLRGKGISTVQL